MTVRRTRSETQCFVHGTVDHKYRQARPDTEVMDIAGNRLMMANRSALDASYNYGLIAMEYPQQLNPGGNVRPATTD